MSRVSPLPLSPIGLAFKKAGEFQLGDEGFATATFVEEEVFVRITEQGAERQEYLYCVSEPYRDSFR
jgi:hypothetical protein